ncbi:hypothetical protein [Spirosoma areae]
MSHENDLVGPPFFVWIHPANTQFDSVTGIECDTVNEAIDYAKAQMIERTGREPVEVNGTHFYDEEAELWADITDAMPF